MQEYDIAIIGGGIVGMAAAMSILQNYGCSVVVLEAEKEIAAHQSGHNSGVIHSGLYYKPGSLKARLCVDGRKQMEHFCSEHSIPYDRCGKLVLATNGAELARLRKLEERGCQNGLTDLRFLNSEELQEIEPHAQGSGGLFVGETGIVDFLEVACAMANVVKSSGAEIKMHAQVLGVHKINNQYTVETTSGTIGCRNLLACAGLQSDRVARLCGVDPGCAIIPFRGEYSHIREDRAHLIRNLIYPVPNPSLPFLGVHFTRMIGGGIEAGPNAVLAMSRKGYRRGIIDGHDLGEAASFPGFWRMLARHWRTGVMDNYRSLSMQACAKALQQLVPELTANDLIRGRSGVRAQAVDSRGRLIDDFHIIQQDNMVHVLNAPSPAATASIAIGNHIADIAGQTFGLRSHKQAA